MKAVNYNVINYIMEDVNLTIARLGINTRLSVMEEQGFIDTFLKVTSKSFQTTPMLFKSINIEGDIFVLKNEKGNCYNITVVLDYRYALFGGGSNGHRLGRIMFEVEKDCWENWNGHHPILGITKVRSLSI